MRLQKTTIKRLTYTAEETAQALTMVKIYSSWGYKIKNSGVFFYELAKTENEFIKL